MNILSRLFSQGKKVQCQETISATKYCEEGNALLKNGKTLQALEYFQAANDLEPDNVESLYGMLDSYKRLGKINKVEVIRKQLEDLIQRNLTPEQEKNGIAEPEENKGRHSNKEANDTPSLSLKDQLLQERSNYKKMLINIHMQERKTSRYEVIHAKYTLADEIRLRGCERHIHKLEKQLSVVESDFNEVRLKILLEKIYKEGYTQKGAERIVKERKEIRGERAKRISLLVFLGITALSSIVLVGVFSGENAILPLVFMLLAYLSAWRFSVHL